VAAWVNFGLVLSIIVAGKKPRCFFLHRRRGLEYPRILLLKHVAGTKFTETTFLFRVLENLLSKDKVIPITEGTLEPKIFFAV
jgi:hypothetical protein